MNRRRHSQIPVSEPLIKAQKPLLAGEDEPFPALLPGRPDHMCHQLSGDALMLPFRHHIQAEDALVTAQTGLEIKKLALLQAVETYEWIVKGVR